MQTFLPYPNFTQTTKCLDNKRLGKQRVEAMQILNAIQYQTGWKNHPIVKMWVGYEDCLKYYCNCMIEEWISRGFKNNMEIYEIPYISSIKYPQWLGNSKFHSSHKAALLAKNFEWYKQFGWTEYPIIEYVWIR
jgi:hypothetical protein